MKPLFNKTRPLSWTAISSFQYNPEQWYKKYVLGEDLGTSREMKFGKIVGKKLETDLKYLPQIPRHSKMEHPFKVMFGKIPMTGYADTFCDKTNRKLAEYKTGKKPWTQKRVDEHGQIDMYCLMNLITNKIRPEDVEITLAWMPTQDNGDFSISFVEPIEKNIKIFRTKRTTTQILNFGAFINQIYKEMEKYAQEHE